VERPRRTARTPKPACRSSERRASADMTAILNQRLSGTRGQNKRDVDDQVALNKRGRAGGGRQVRPRYRRHQAFQALNGEP
jgi:hypothetical protein